MTAPADRRGAVQVEVSRHCEVILRGGDERAVLDRLAAWVRQRHADILITGLTWTHQWTLDEDGVVAGDQRMDHVITMQFRTGAQRDLGVGRGLRCSLLRRGHARRAGRECDSLEGWPRQRRPTPPRVAERPIRG
jgi:hypothetical protein